MRAASCLSCVLLCGLLAASATVHAQRGRAGGGPPATARQSAPAELAGYWVSPITEDWKFRMVTPAKGIFDGVPLSAQGRKVGESWDPARDEAAGEQCRAYGAPAIMRLPGRLRLSWQDDATLKVETDTGTQTRLLHFGAASPPTAPTWQGHSAAKWNTAARTIEAVTTHLRPGYLRRNGAPYSDRTIVTEYWTLNTLPNGDRWLTVITKVEDPQYLTRPYTTSSDFKKLPDAAGWNPTPCSAR